MSKVTLYHGSEVIIRKPEFGKGNVCGTRLSSDDGYVL